ncbi:MAG: precorrin-3B C(17)-methyltransferase, partial [Lachnospiraceae bacterium]|nr:precorrin-3B C(17)-methyltransferase [Lachnospiraceae bacterium]
GNGDDTEDDERIDIKVIPGVTAALSGAAMLGAPVAHDMCTISLSDLLTPWDVIEKRLRCAAEGDFCIAIYNPASKKRTDNLKNACDILLEILPPDRPCGIARNIGRSESSAETCTLKELRDKNVDMFTTVFIGNSRTYISNGKLITPRGYEKA